MSAPNINSVTLVGRLTAEPTLRELPNGKPVCELRRVPLQGPTSGRRRPPELPRVEGQRRRQALEASGGGQGGVRRERRVGRGGTGR
jgi:hypothetical protein